MQIKSKQLTRVAPASHLIQYERLKFQTAIGNDTSPYQGWPNDEIDARWQDMYNGMVTDTRSEMAGN